MRRKSYVASTVVKGKGLQLAGGNAGACVRPGTEGGAGEVPT